MMVQFLYSINLSIVSFNVILNGMGSDNESNRYVS